MQYSLTDPSIHCPQSVSQSVSQFIYQSAYAPSGVSLWPSTHVSVIPSLPVDHAMRKRTSIQRPWIGNGEMVGSRLSCQVVASRAGVGGG
jgi:hypothetical protein